MRSGHTSPSMPTGWISQTKSWLWAERRQRSQSGIFGSCFL
ncbi:MAG: hypothetical protein ACK5UZ_07620 [Pseudanabaena sp.]